MSNTLCQRSLLTSGRAAGKLASHTRVVRCIGAPGITALPLTKTTPSHHERHFSTTRPAQLKVKEWFPPTANKNIEYAPAAWNHPVYAASVAQVVLLSRIAVLTSVTATRKTK